MDGVGNADEVGGATGRARLPFDHPVPRGYSGNCLSCINCSSEVRSKIRGF